MDKGGYWQPLQGTAVLSVAEGEERLPMRPVQILSKPPSPRSVFTDNIAHELHYGYIPAGNRSKYRDTLRRTMAAVPDPQTLVNDFISDAQAADPGLNSRRELFFAA